MVEINKSMAILSPILFRISKVAQSVVKARGPNIKITRNPPGIIELLDFARESKNTDVQLNYKKLFSSEETQSLQHLAELGHRYSELSGLPPDSSTTPRSAKLYRGVELKTAKNDKMVSDRDTNTSVGIKTKTVKIVYRGRVTYKEVPAD